MPSCRDGSMKRYKFWRFLMLKRYFDTGLGLTSYFTKILMIIGIGFAVDNIKNTLWIVFLGLAYFMFCMVLGWIWLKFGLFETELEILNKFNPFVKEARNGELGSLSPKKGKIYK